MQNLFCPCRVTSGYHTALNWENGMWGTHAVIVTLPYICSFFYGALYWATHARNLLIIQCPWRCTYNFNVCSSWNDWESDFLLTAKKNCSGMACTFRMEDAEIVDVWLSRCWQGIQVEISSSQLETHDRLPLLVTEMKAQELFWKV